MNKRKHLTLHVRNKQINNQPLRKYTNTFIVISMQRFTLPQKIRRNLKMKLHCIIYHHILVHQIQSFIYMQFFLSKHAYNSQEVPLCKCSLKKKSNQNKYTHTYTHTYTHILSQDEKHAWSGFKHNLSQNNC